jgi:radical SAM protein with 4Fe4S-binding SPASM domain
MFCPHPWSRLEVKADGGVYCCCEGWLPKRLGNVLDQDLLEIWRGEAAREVRESVDDGSFRYCSACPYLPEVGGPVVASEPTAFGPYRGARRLRTLKLDYDASCNLACPSCRTTHSRNFVDQSLVSRIHERVVGSGVLDLAEQLYVTGSGDPFASPTYWKMLRELRPNPRNPTMTLWIHTNGLLLDDHHWRDMGVSREMVSDVGISVDAATPATYAALRGGSWARLWRNVEFLNSVQEQRPPSRPVVLGMFYTVQAKNHRELPAFLDLAFRHKVSWVSVTALRNWGSYSDADYLSRAVHRPDHPDHASWREVLAHPLVRDPRIALDRFDPRHVRQEHVIDANHLSRRRA